MFLGLLAAGGWATHVGGNSVNVVNSCSVEMHYVWCINTALHDA